MTDTKSKLKALDRLKELRAEADSIDYSWDETQKFKEWKLAVQAALRKLFGEESQYLKEFRDNHWSLMVVTNYTTDDEWERAFFGGLGRARAIIGSAIREIEDYELDITSHSSLSLDQNRPGMARKAFVVHGHDNEMKETVARFLAQLEIEPIILHEQASRGRTVIEKIEDNSDVGFAIVLLSPDDIGGAAGNARNLQSRARQNVILELGYFLGRLSRHRVCAILRGKIELPSDFLGIVYVPFEGEIWKAQIMRELKALGFEIDANKAF
jgi:predicted nucleotide-binding protein